MGKRINSHIPSKDYERDSGHEFYYKREERTALPNAVRPRKSFGMRRFVILFLDLILAIGGVTIIRSCLATNTKETKTYSKSGANAFTKTHVAKTTIEKVTGIVEYRLTISRQDRKMFILNTNLFSVKVAIDFSGKKNVLQTKTLSPNEKLISHQYFLTISENKKPNPVAVFHWKISTNKTISITNRFK